MIISKWTLDFKANQEASIAPIWVSFLKLLFHFFNMHYLNKLASLLRKPLRVDTVTLDLRWPSVARVLGELDVSKPPTKRV